MNFTQKKIQVNLFYFDFTPPIFVRLDLEMVQLRKVAGTAGPLAELNTPLLTELESCTCVRVLEK